MKQMWTEDGRRLPEWAIFCETRGFSHELERLKWTETELYPLTVSEVSVRIEKLSHVLSSCLKI